MLEFAVVVVTVYCKMCVENIRVHDGVRTYHTQSPLSEGAEIEARFSHGK